MTETRTATDAITHRERVFVDAYVKTLKQTDAAVVAGFKKSSAAVSAWQMMKRPRVCLAIAEALKEKSLLARIDASWVLKRLALLADFSIKNFIVVDDNTGRLYYDFKKATDDDWYCINEITLSAVRAQARAGDKIWVDQVRIKTGDKIRALELVGKHVAVQAFKERAMGGDEPVTEVTRVIVTRALPAPAETVEAAETAP